MKARKTKLKKSCICVALTVAMCLSFVPFAQATPSKQQQAQQLKSQLDSLQTSLDAAVENYNAAQVKYDSITAKQKSAQKKIKEADSKITKLQGRLSNRAVAMYRGGKTSFLEVLLGAQSFQEFSTLWDTLNQLNDNDAALVSQIKDAKQEQVDAKKEYDKQASEAKAQLDEMSKQKSTINSKIAAQKSALDSVNADIAAEAKALQAQEQRRAAAAAASSTSSSGRSSRSGGSGGGGGAFSGGDSQSWPTPPGSSKGAQAVAVARAQLGKPYVWAASGPSSFDCSGLTMYCYAKVGVSLPHSSRAQINCGARVNRSDLQPGDLVFYGSPIHHVGIYIGGGQMIHAPTTGDVVKISGLQSDYAGACRP